MRELISFHRAIKIQLVLLLLHQIQFYHALSFTLYANAASNTRVYNNTTWIQWCTIQLLVVGWSFNDGSIFRVANKYLEIYHNKMSQTTSPRLFFLPWIVFLEFLEIELWKHYGKYALVVVLARSKFHSEPQTIICSLKYAEWVTTMNFKNNKGLFRNRVQSQPS